MEDVLEQLVGDIWDETDTVEKDVVKHGDGKYELDGDTPIYEFLELMGWKEDDFDFDSETVRLQIQRYRSDDPGSVETESQTGKGAG